MPDFFGAPYWILILLAVTCVSWLVQTCLRSGVWGRPLSHARREERGQVPFTESQPPVSVVVYAHNQAEELLRNLPVLLDSHYPTFEVIVVDDGSTDETDNVMTQMEQRALNFFHTSIAQKVRTVSHRKLAMMLGVKAAHYDIILMTQAQCMPASADWIARMVRNFTPRTDVVVGPMAFEGRTGLMNRFYQWDLFERMNEMMALTLAVQPYGGWGQNLAFRKEVFFANHNEGFSRHLNVQPGEDDLFVADVRHNRNIAVECSEAAMIINQVSPLRYWWKKDRLNRAFTSQQYALASRLVKHLDSATRFLFLLPAWAVLAYAVWRQMWLLAGIVALLLLLHGLQVALVPHALAKRLGLHRYLFSPLVCELLTPLVNVQYRLKALFSSRDFYVAHIGK